MMTEELTRSSVAHSCAASGISAARSTARLSRRRRITGTRGEQGAELFQQRAADAADVQELRDAAKSSVFHPVREDRSRARGPDAGQPYQRALARMIEVDRRRWPALLGF